MSSKENAFEFSEYFWYLKLPYQSEQPMRFATFTCPNPACDLTGRTFNARDVREVMKKHRRKHCPGELKYKIKSGLTIYL